MPIARRLRKAGYRMLGLVTEQSLVGSFKKKISHVYFRCYLDEVSLK